LASHQLGLLKAGSDEISWLVEQGAGQQCETWHLMQNEKISTWTVSWLTRSMKSEIVTSQNVTKTYGTLPSSSQQSNNTVTFRFTEEMPLIGL